MKKIFFYVLVLLTCKLQSQPPGCSAQKDVANNTGQGGLFGEYVAGYFSDNPSYFTSTVSATNRIESTINYTTNNWGVGIPPATGTAADQNDYSARYRGSIYIASAGTYTFYLTSDDGSFLWIDNAAIAYPAVIANALINDGGLHGNVTVAASTSLTAGLHNLQIQYGEQAGGNNLIFEYAATSPSIARQVVPNSILCTGIQASITPAAIVPPPGCSCNAGVTSQFYTGYFNDVQTYFTSNTPVISRQDPTIGFTTDGGWGSVCPPLAGSNASPETFSTRFSGQIYIPVATTYTFYLTSDDASYFWLDGNAVATNPTSGTAAIGNGGTHSATTVSAVITLTVGLHDFKIHYGENTGNNVCYLEYASSTIPRQIIPQSSYCTCMSIGTLPIELLGFTAELTPEKNVLVKWQTASELNNKQFDVERSVNGIDFIKIGSVPAKGNGNSKSLNSYALTDVNPQPGVFYYRLKQVDINGSYKMYNPVSVEFNIEDHITFKVFPNPNTGTFTLYLSGVPGNSNSEISIYTVDGKRVYFNEIDKGSMEEHSINLNVSLGLTKGLYIANCIVNGVKYPLKISVE